MVKRSLSQAGSDPLISIQYLERLLDWRLWENKADELLEAAKLLEPYVRESWNVITTDFNEGKYSDPLKAPRTPPFNPQSAYFMLVAYALENLLKGIIIRRRYDEYRNRLRKTLPRDLNKHDLRDLFKKANVSFTVCEEDLLHRLYLQSTWAGRYPIPVKACGLKNIEMYSDGKSYLTACFYPDDVDHLKDLVKRVNTIIKDKTETIDNQSI